MSTVHWAPTYWLVNQPTQSGKCFGAFPKKFFIASFIGTLWMWSSDSWREAEETQESHLDSCLYRPVSDPECPFYNLLQSQQVYSVHSVHSADSTTYSLNRSSLQSAVLLQLSLTVLFIRSSRVKEVWLACCWNAHRIKARKTCLDNHW